MNATLTKDSITLDIRFSSYFLMNYVHQIFIINTLSHVHVMKLWNFCHVWSNTTHIFWLRLAWHNIVLHNTLRPNQATDGCMHSHRLLHIILHNLEASYLTYLLVYLRNFIPIPVCIHTMYSIVLACAYSEYYYHPYHICNIHTKYPLTHPNHLHLPHENVAEQVPTMGRVVQIFSKQ